MEDQVKLRESMEAFCLSPIMGLNSYWTELLGNVMFQSIGFKNDRFYIQKNILLCASLVFDTSNYELVNIALKDIGRYK